MTAARSMTRGTIAAVVFITLVWGLNWPMMKFSLREITPLYFRAITMTGGVLLLLVWLKRGAVDANEADTESCGDSCP